MADPHVPDDVQPLVDWCKQPATSTEASHALYFTWFLPTEAYWGIYTGLLFYRPPTSQGNSRPRLVGWGQLVPPPVSSGTIPAPPEHRWVTRINIRIDSQYLIAGVTFHDFANRNIAAETSSPVAATATGEEELEVLASAASPFSGEVVWQLGGGQLQLTKTTVNL